VARPISTPVHSSTYLVSRPRSREDCLTGRRSFRYALKSLSACESRRRSRLCESDDDSIGRRGIPEAFTCLRWTRACHAAVRVSSSNVPPPDVSTDIAVHRYRMPLATAPYRCCRNAPQSPSQLSASLLSLSISRSMDRSRDTRYTEPGLTRSERSLALP